MIPALVSESMGTSSHLTMHRVLFMMRNHLGPTVSSVRSSKQGPLVSGGCQYPHHYGVSKGDGKDRGRQSERVWKSWARKERWPKVDECYREPLKIYFWKLFLKYPNATNISKFFLLTGYNCTYREAYDDFGPLHVIFINSERFGHPSSQAHGFIGMRTSQILSASYFELYNTTLLIIVTLYVEEHPQMSPLLCCGFGSVASSSSVLLSLWFQDSTVCSARSDTSDFTQG